MAFLFLAIAVIVGIISFVHIQDISSAAQIMIAAPQPVNSPIGEAKGINPGRVVWVYDPDATNWEGPGNGHWWESSHTDQTEVDKMLSRAIRGLVGESNDADAWDSLFRDFNQKHGKDDVGYTPGEKVAIKVNLVGCIDSVGWGGVDPATYNLVSKMDYMNTSPQMMLALLRQLIYTVGVNPADISIGDPLCLFPNQYYTPLHDEFPEVQYLDSRGLFGRTAVQESSVPFYWSSRPAGKTQDYVLNAFAEANYFINLSNLKSHSAGGVTLCGKNYYGWLRFPAQFGYYDMHTTLPSSVSSSGEYRAIVDLMGHDHSGGKALLYMIDGLYAGVHAPVFDEETTDDAPRKWALAPFSNDWTSSLFISQDPVAIDSVGFDFLQNEGDSRDYPKMAGADDYIHEAALANNPSSGTFYDPDHATNIVRLNSLGVHEHWNNPTSKQYSRNLNPAGGTGIELVALSEQVATPTFDPTGGTFRSAQEVTITCATDSTAIHYTTDGAEPTQDSTEYTDPIIVNSPTTLKARAYKTDWDDSEIASTRFTISRKPRFDLDGNNADDLVGLTASGKIYYSLNKSSWVNIPGILSKLAVGDFNGNGYSDVAGLNVAGRIYYTTNRSAWTNIPGVMSFLAAGDLNGNGEDDLAGINSTGKIYYTYNKTSWANIPGRLASIAVGDLNNDGKYDVVGLSSTGKIYFSTDKATWSTIPGRLSKLAVGDFNGDGVDDIAGLNSTGKIYYTTDKGVLWKTIPGMLASLAIGDLNGDGNDDIAGLSSTGKVYYSTNKTTWLRISGVYASLAVGDLNGDESDDIAGLKSNGSIWYTTNKSTWKSIPGTLAKLYSAR